MIRSVSKRKSKELYRFGKLSKAYLLEHPMCERCNESKSTQLHHKKGRGIYLCVVEFFMAACFSCHEWIERNRKQAMEDGWLIDRIGKGE